MSDLPLPDLTFDQWVALPVEEAVDWWMARMDKTGDTVRRKKLIRIISRERERLGLDNGETTGLR